jgi:Protein of unknown function (DUF3237)
METLPHKHLTTLRLDVAFDAMTSIGKTPAGHRLIAPVTGGTFEGSRLRGAVVGGADWVINRADGVMNIDVRLTLRTHDGANAYLTYQGRLLAGEEATARFRKGELLDPSEYSLVIVARFECGDERYKWVNNVIAAGTGEQTRTGPIYTLHEIG